MSAVLDHIVPSMSSSVSSLNSPLEQSNGNGVDWVVQKFGGTSVGKFPIKIARDVVKRYRDDGNRIVIVVSARSTGTKAEGTTNRLLAAIKEAQIRYSTKYVEIVNEILEDHISAADQYVSNEELRNELKIMFREECEYVSRVLGAAQILEEVSPKTKDMVVGVGEKLSCLFMTAVLKDQGVDARAITLEKIVPSRFKEGRGLDHAFYKAMSETMAQVVLDGPENQVSVVTGFFGPVPGSLLSQVGRGYTDLCAALFAIGLQASELQVWKEVDGIFTADPRKVPTARLLATITPEEAAELTYYGSEVIHPFFTNLVSQARVPIRIKNVENPAGEGTVILSDNLDGSVKRGVNSPYRTPRAVQGKTLYARAIENAGKDRSPTAVTAKDHIVIVNVHSNRRSLSHGFYATLFGILDRYRVIVDLISTSEVHVSMAVHSDNGEAELRTALDELQALGTVEVLSNMIILSLVGKQMKNMVGIAAKMFTTLASNNVNIEMISQGASEINISCVIDSKDMIKALNVIHHTLIPPK